jgi:hypothetical protein
MGRPRLSVVVIVYNMRREATRTLHSLSAAYQEDVEPADYDVHVVENGSSAPLDEDFVRQHGRNFHYHRLDNAPPSPAHAINYGIAHSGGTQVAIMIDGAHMLTPRVLTYAMRLADAVPVPVVAVRQFYLGPGQQPDTTQNGYNQAAEDELLRSVGWPKEPYRIFEIGAFIGKQRPGWFGRFFESNCLIAPRTVLEAIGGCDERFDVPGGGFVNLDLFARCALHPGAQVFMLLGEGSFHQVHGGTTTNVSREEAEVRIERYRRQYEALRGRPYEVPRVDLQFFGALHPRSFVI